MPHFKWSIIILLVVLPLMMLLADYVGHNNAKADADTALKSSAQYAMKKSVLKGSLRDTDIYRTQHTIELNDEALIEGFDSSFTRTKAGVMLSIAGVYDSGINGYMKNPPMIAVRSNVVRKSLVYGVVSTFIPNLNPQYVIQSQKIVILEHVDIK